MIFEIFINLIVYINLFIIIQSYNKFKEFSLHLLIFNIFSKKKLNILNNFENFNLTFKFLAFKNIFFTK